MALPAEIRAGDTVIWLEDPTVDGNGDTVSSADWTGTAYLRHDAAAEGLTVTGTAATGGGWTFTISASSSATMDAGQWFAQVVATKSSDRVTLAAGSFTVLPDLSYSGTPSAYDGRTEAEQELAEVRAAIRALVVKGAAQYSIGSRSYTALDLGRLTARESQLRAIVAREKAAAALAAGRADGRDVFVRFG